MSPHSTEFAMRVEAELMMVGTCVRGCESHRAVELNLAYLRHIAACAAPAPRATKAAQLAQALRTESAMEEQEKTEDVKKYKFPKTIGACVDRAYQLREKRLKLEREAADLKREEEATKVHVLETFDKNDVEGVRGKVATAGLTRRTVGTVVDWDAFYGYIKKNDAFDMLHRRLSDGAYRERLDVGEDVPGVKPYEVVSLSLTKR